MFVDAAKVKLSAGKGGDGAVAWRREKYIPKGGPAGGNGGKGGSIYIQADYQVLSLKGYRNRSIIKAENGRPGGSALKQGRGGEDLLLKVPLGTLVKDRETGEILYDFTEDKQKCLICQGGRGGKGNNCFKSPTNQAPTMYTPGTEGENKEVELELKLIADIGLIGFPNAGKSTLLSQLTPLKAKIGAYPFTTLYPNLSYIKFPDHYRLLLADIPGIIENAHADRGLGLAFLKHVERTSALIFLLDASGFENRDPIQDFQTLRNELKEYRTDLLDKPFLVALNKTDGEGAEEQIKIFRAAFPQLEGQLFTISALTGDGLPTLKTAMRALIEPVAEMQQ